MDDEDFFDGDESVGSARFEPADVFVTLFMLLAGIASAFATVFQHLTRISAMHSNWKVEQREFHTEAAREIETLPTTEA